TIGAGMYEPGHAMRTDSGAVGFKIGEQDGRDTTRARELVRIMNDVALTKLTTNLWGERWSKLAINCMANPLAGLSGLGSAGVRARPGPRAPRAGGWSRSTGWRRSASWTPLPARASTRSRRTWRRASDSCAAGGRPRRRDGWKGGRAGLVYVHVS